MYGQPAPRSMDELHYDSVHAGPNAKAITLSIGKRDIHFQGLEANASVNALGSRSKAVKLLPARQFEYGVSR